MSWSPAQLEVGDTVVVEGRGVRSISKVWKRTPTGRLNIGRTPESTQQFDARGNLIGGGVWDTTSLREATPALMEEIRREAMAVRLSRMTVAHWCKLPLADLVEIHNKVKS